MRYSDINRTVSQSEPTQLVYDIDSINRSIETIILTRKKSRPFRRVFGSEVATILFEPMDELTVVRIRHNCISAIEKWESRVTVKTLDIVPDYENQQYYVKLVYVIPELNNTEITYTFGLSK